MINEKKSVVQAPRAGTTAVASQQKVLPPIEQAMLSFGALIPKLKTNLPPHITPERFLSVTRIALLKNPKLIDLDRASLVNAALECSADGLVPDGREAAFVEFKGKVKHMPMVQGIIKKIRQSGEVAIVSSHVIYENDRFRYWVDQNGVQVLFEPDFFSVSRGEPIGAFAMAKFKDGDLAVEPMTREQIMDVKNVSPAAKSEYSPWNGPFEMEMWRKTVIRRLSKSLPMSNETQEIIDRENDIIGMENKPKSKIDDLREKLASQNNQAMTMSAEDIAAADSIEVESIPIEAKKRNEDPNGFDNFHSGGPAVADPKMVK